MSNYVGSKSVFYLIPVIKIYCHIKKISAGGFKKLFSKHCPPHYIPDFKHLLIKCPVLLGKFLRTHILRYMHRLTSVITIHIFYVNSFCFKHFFMIYSSRNRCQYIKSRYNYLTLPYKVGSISYGLLCIRIRSDYHFC